MKQQIRNIVMGSNEGDLVVESLCISMTFLSQMSQHTNIDGQRLAIVLLWRMPESANERKETNEKDHEFSKVKKGLKKISGNHRGFERLSNASQAKAEESNEENLF